MSHHIPWRARDGLGAGYQLLPDTGVSEQVAPGVEGVIKLPGKHAGQLQGWGGETRNLLAKPQLKNPSLWVGGLFAPHSCLTTPWLLMSILPATAAALPNQASRAAPVPCTFYAGCALILLSSCFNLPPHPPSVAPAQAAPSPATASVRRTHTATRGSAVCLA